MPRNIVSFVIKLLLLVVILLNPLIITNSYKLNVPKVLLPFHSSKLISFMLEVKNDNNNTLYNGGNTGHNGPIDDDLCFVWSSSRPDVVTITPIFDDTSKLQQKSSKNNLECSSKAMVSAVSKHAQRMTSIILAKEISKSLNKLTPRKKKN
jgi:hypothetical protein